MAAEVHRPRAGAVAAGGRMLGLPGEFLGPFCPSRGSSDSRRTTDCTQAQGVGPAKAESIRPEAVACPAVRAGPCGSRVPEEVSGKRSAAPNPTSAAHRGGARAQEEDGAAAEIHQRDPAGESEECPAASWAARRPTAASPALLAHTVRPLAGPLAGPSASPRPRAADARAHGTVLEWVDRLLPRPAGVVSGGGSQPDALSAQTCL